MISDLSNPTTTLKDGYNGFVLPSPIETTNDIALATSTIVSGSGIGYLSSIVSFTVNALLPAKFIDPETGSFFTFSQDSNSPALTAVSFVDNGVAAEYKIWANPNQAGSAYTLVAPGQTASFGSGIESFGFEALDQNGTPVDLPDGFLIDATYAGGGTVNATVDSSGNAFFAAAGPVCFASGTAIRTTRGNVAVEHLALSDIVVTASGVHRPIRWLGHRTVDCRHPQPQEAMPVRISAHAFEKNRPSRDLLVSPGHSICIDLLGEVLIPAAALVNGTTISRRRSRELEAFRQRKHTSPIDWRTK